MGMAFVVMAFVVMAYVVMAYGVMAYTVVAATPWWRRPERSDSADLFLEVGIERSGHRRPLKQQKNKKK